MRPTGSVSASLSTKSVSPSLFQRVFKDDNAALQNWSSYKHKHFPHPIEIYLRFIRAEEKTSLCPTSLNERGVAVQSSAEMHMACAFVLASNHQWNFQYHYGKLYLIPGSLEDVDTSMLFDIQRWCDAPTDALTYEFFLRDKHLPERFVDFILAPYLKKLCASGGTNSARVEDSNKQSTSSKVKPSKEDDAGSSDQNAGTLPTDDASTYDIDERIEAAFTKFNIRATPKASIEKSITPQRFMAAKSELLQRNAKNINQSSANAGEPSVTPLATVATPQESSPVVQQETIPPLQQVNTNAFVDDEYRKYLLKKTLQTYKRCWKKNLLLTLDSIMQWVRRSKRIYLLHMLDMAVGSTVNVILAYTALGGVFFIAAPIYALAATGTLIFWFVAHSVTFYCMKRWHQNKSTCLRNTIIELEANISAYEEHSETVRQRLLNRKDIEPDSLAEGSTLLTQKSVDLKQFEIELKQCKQKLLKSLTYLSRHNSITNALIKERRAFDRIAKEVKSLKDTASNSFKDANCYETAQSELECQEKHLAEAMEPVTESLTLALEIYSQDKLSIENDINTLLGSDNSKKELDIFGSMNAEDFSQLLSEASHVKWKSKIFSVFQRIWHTIYKPPIVEQMLDDSRKESLHNKETLFGLFSEKAHEIIPEKHTEIGHENPPNFRNPNTLLANLFSKAKQGIHTSHVISEQANNLTKETFSRGTQTVFRTFVGYSIYYLRRIPYRLHESGVTWALMSGIKLNFLNLLKDAFPIPWATGGIGIIFWGWFQYMANKFEKRNNRQNKALCTSRENYIKNYHDPYDKDAIPSWMALKPGKAADGTTIVRTREQLGYFNAGVLDDSPVQALSEHEWRAIRRQAKHAFVELPHLMKKFEEVKLKFSTLIEQLHAENQINPSNKIVVKAPRVKIARLLIHYNLLAHHIQQTIKTAQLANYECVRHVHRVNQKMKIQSRPQK